MNLLIFQNAQSLLNPQSNSNPYLRDFTMFSSMGTLSP
jgi:hypothetical protein